MKKTLMMLTIAACTASAWATVSYTYSSAGGSGYTTVYGMSESTLNEMLGKTVSTTVKDTVTDPTTESPRYSSVGKGGGVIYDVVAQWVLDTTGSFNAIKENAAQKTVASKDGSSRATKSLSGNVADNKWAFILYEDTNANEYKFRVVITTTTSMDGNYGSWTGWVTADSKVVDPIPEPTSGLLMLLGVSGLALKRKRA